ncbi:MAG: sulfatase-like hydrolase/transferase, partial [Bryobacterales bacterium]|nr:sulfatase-like hydrolase/transferase [Bryobacterales bacterium]
MRRRDLFFAPLTPLLTAQSRRPNIVLFLADDLSYRDIEPYGGKQVRTPHLAALARQGICFDAMFTATAMCAPLRQQLLTGMFPVRNGAYPNHSRVYDGVKGLPLYFQDLGYRVGRVGKKHFGPDASFPFEVVDEEEPRPGKLNKVEAFLRRDAARPFFLWMASHQPHAPFNQGNAADYPPANIQVPGHLVDTPATRSVLGRYFAEVAVLDAQLGAVLE